MMGVEDMKEQGMSVSSVEQPNGTKNLVLRLRIRASIRRNIPTRKSVQEGAPDKLSDLLEEAANRIEYLEEDYQWY